MSKHKYTQNDKTTSGELIIPNQSALKNNELEEKQILWLSELYSKYNYNDYEHTAHTDPDPILNYTPKTTNSSFSEYAGSAGSGEKIINNKPKELNPTEIFSTDTAGSAGSSKSSDPTGAVSSLIYHPKSEKNHIPPTNPLNPLSNDDEGWIPTHRREREKILHWKDATRVRDLLIENKIIEVDWSYVNNIKGIEPYTQRERILNIYEPATTYKIKDKRLINAINNRNEKRIKGLPEYIQELEGQQINIIDHDWKGAEKETTRNIYKYKLQLENQLQRINTPLYYSVKSPKLFSIKIAPQTGRITTVITNTPKELRKYNSIKGEHLYEIDGSNFIPLLLNYYIKKLNLDNEPDAIEWKYLTENGLLYEQLQNIWETKTRDDAKQLIMYALFGKNKAYPTALLNKELKIYYPSVIKTLRHLKRNDHRNCAITLMHLESEIMIRHLTKDLINRGIILFPCHDAIYTIPNNIELVEHKIIEYTKLIAGVTPHIKIKSTKDINYKPKQNTLPGWKGVK